ncbi:MAG: hypothetical protein QXR30_00180 [Candidatus Woesearchaeota archaeon]
MFLVFTFLPSFANNGCEIIELKNFLNTKNHIECLNISQETNFYQKEIKVTIDGVVTKRNNVYEYDASITFDLNINDLEFEKTLIIQIQNNYQTLSVSCSNFSLKKDNTFEYIYLEQHFQKFDNNTNTTYNVSFFPSQIKCNVKGIVVLENYLTPFEIAFRNIKIIPVAKISVLKSYLPEIEIENGTISKELLLNQTIRGVGVKFENDKNYSMKYNFKLYREINSNKTPDFENLKEILNGSVIVHNAHSLFISFKDVFYENSIYWIEAEPYYNLKYNIKNNTLLRIIYPSAPGGTTGGSSGFIMEEVQDNKNISKKNITEEEAEEFCIPLFSRKVLIEDIEKRIIKVSYEIINPCKEEKNIIIQEPLLENGALIEISEGKIVNKIITLNLTLKSNEKRTISYLIRYLEDESLILYPSATVKVDDKIYIINNEILKMKPFKGNAIFIKKIIEFIENDLVKITIEINNLGEKTNFYIKDLSKTYSSLTVPFYKPGVWQINLLENEMWKVQYLTTINDEIYTIPQVIGFSGKVFFSIISSTKTSEKLEIKQQSTELIPIAILIGSIIVLSVFTIVEITKAKESTDSWENLEKSLKDLLKKL